jgi:hypothetical protein
MVTGPPLSQKAYVVWQARSMLFAEEILTFKYQATTGTFLAFAITFAIARLTIRAHILRRVHVDDYFLILALAALISSNALFFAVVPKIYFFTNPSTGQVLLD